MDPTILLWHHAQFVCSSVHACMPATQLLSLHCIVVVRSSRLCPDAVAKALVIVTISPTLTRMHSCEHKHPNLANHNLRSAKLKALDKGSTA